MELKNWRTAKQLRDQKQEEIILTGTLAETGEAEKTTLKNLQERMRNNFLENMDGVQ